MLKVHCACNLRHPSTIRDLCHRWVQWQAELNVQLQTEPRQAGDGSFGRGRRLKGKEEPRGTTPGRLAGTAVDCVISWNSLSLTFLALGILSDDAIFSWSRLPLSILNLDSPSGCLLLVWKSFCAWHVFLLVSFSDDATFSPSSLRLSSLNFDDPSCWQLWGPRPDTLFSPDKLLSLPFYSVLFPNFIISPVFWLPYI